jgi:MFS family permease
LLLALNLCNYADRYILAAVLPKIEEAFIEPGDALAKTKLGWLTTAFLVSYLMLAPLFGWLGDRMSRWLLVGIGVVLWSLASGASGLAASYLVLLLTRCFVGIGEAAYGPAAPALISDLFPIQVRGRVLAWFFAAIPVGGALGYVLGGAMADSPLGWRWGFFAVVPPGLLLGSLCFFMREPPRGQADVLDQPVVPARWKNYLVLARIPSYVLNTLGMTAMTFAVGGIAVWMPTAIYEREAHFRWTAEVDATLAQQNNSIPKHVRAKLQPLLGKEFDRQATFIEQIQSVLSPAEMQAHSQAIMDEARAPKLSMINAIFGVIVVVSGLAGTLLGSLAGEWLRPRFTGSYFLVSGFSMLLAFPMVLLAMKVPFPACWLVIFIAVFCLFFNTGPTSAILANVAHPAIRSTAFALNILIIHALGDAISPVVMGAIADFASMEWAFVAVSLVILLGGIFWIWGARYLEEDTVRAASRL